MLQHCDPAELKGHYNIYHSFTCYLKQLILKAAEFVSYNNSRVYVRCYW